jgi:hypothetical protein
VARLYPQALGYSSSDPDSTHSLPPGSHSQLTLLLAYNISARTTQKHRSSAACVSFAATMCLPRRSPAAAVYYCLLRLCCLPRDVVPLSVSRPLRSNEYCFRAVRWQQLSLWLHSSCFVQIYHNTYGGNGCIAPSILYIGIKLCCSGQLHTRPLHLGERDVDAHCTGEWVGARAGVAPAGN